MESTAAGPRSHWVQCISPAGLHRMHYREWGDPRNPLVLVCVHGLTRLGRDFDRLARALCARFRVVCPDVVGRGLSDRLRDPRFYMVPQYVSDMVTLVARLDVERVSWVGTSMGGLIGMSLAGLPGSPIERLVINDVGPRIEVGAFERIATYVGLDPHFDDPNDACAYLRSTYAGFGLRSEEDWRELTAASLRADGGGYALHYDPAISVPLKTFTRASIESGEAALWALYDAIACPTLLVRGGRSDLFSAQAAARMQARGPRPQLVTFEGVGHAPMFFDTDQIEAVRRFLLA